MNTPKLILEKGSCIKCGGVLIQTEGQIKHRVRKFYCHFCNYTLRREEWKRRANKYGSLHKRDIVSRRKYASANKDKLAKLRRDWYDQNPGAIQAHTKIHEAVKYGRIKRQPCSICGCEKSEAHHECYDNPLDVIWLCRKHHVLFHIEKSR